MFMSAQKLGLEDAEYEALKKTLDLLESDGIVHSHSASRQDNNKMVFNMDSWHNRFGCGSVCCIGGTAEVIGNLKPFSLDDKTYKDDDLRELFFPRNIDSYEEITTKQAAAALRNYLTTGKPNWECALS